MTAEHQTAETRADPLEEVTLDEAWAAVEAVRPEGWSLLIGDTRRQGKDGWWATASEPFDEVIRGYKIVSTSENGKLYATPAAALLALVTALTPGAPDHE